MKKIIVRFFVYALFVSTSLAQNPVAENGQLKVIGHQLSKKLETVDPGKLNDIRNVMFTFHFYTTSHKSLYPMFANQIHRIPVFVSEWGTCESSGMGNLDLETSSKFLNTMKQHILDKDTVSISWCNFSYGDKAESTSVLKPRSCADGLWDNTTPGGDFIKYWIKYNNAPEINLKKNE